MWAQKDEKDFWIHWLENYREFKCLWDPESKKNSNRAQRQIAYQELADLAKVVNPAADTDFVRSRINAFRTCYRREFKKMDAARQRGIEYKPQLFYFDTLKFVNPEEYPEDSFFSIETEDIKKETDHNLIEHDPISFPKCAEETAKRLLMRNEAIKRSLPKASRDISTITPEKKKVQLIEPCFDPDIDIEYDPVEVNFSTINDETQSQINYQTHCANEDEYSIFGKRIAAHFRNMQTNQRLIAEKIISDVCIYARMERLTLKSSVVIDTPPANQDCATVKADIDYDDPDTYIYTT